ncbi:MAG: hypothetical protein Q7S61_06280 [bacterium]|nr:hypothetical protein [bacterium]
MKKMVKIGIQICFLLVLVLRFLPLWNILHAQDLPPTSSGVDVVVCQSGCIEQLGSGGYYPGKEKCVSTYEEYKKDTFNNHLWVYDQEVFNQGKADERARQFLYWVLTHPSIDDHPTLKNIWSFTRNIAYFFILLISVVMGIGIIIAQRQNFSTKIEISPLVVKLLVGLLYITFSGAIVITIIQFSEILMKFFIETLGGKDLFNIYFTGVSEEKNYIEWIGCRDLNIHVQEAANAEMFLLKVTNITYYIMGIMLLLRKILLWFLLFVSPFLALLMPFIFIRNTGWIWIGVFFQWVFYGPLFALFLGGLARIWKNGIPFPFNFSRVNQVIGYIYPTGINIGYGGPAQVWNDSTKPVYTNNGNYVDTFAEYIITLIMLWAVTFFPWWLLRIFRDYCCDGIYAMKNILLSMYDQMRGGPSPSGPGPVPTPSTTNTGSAMNIPKEIETPVHIKLETIEEIKKTQTEQITRSLNLSASKLTDIARFETNKQTQENVVRNINMLSNPMKAETPTERQKYMNIRTELYSRSVKEDKIATQILSATSTSRVEQLQKREEFLSTKTELKPVTHVISVKVQMPTQKVSSISSQMLRSVTNNTSIINAVSQTTHMPQQQVQTIVTSFIQHIQEAPTKIVESITKETGIEKEKVKQVVTNVATVLKMGTQVKDASTVQNISQTTNIPIQQVRTILSSYTQHVHDTPANKVDTITKETGIEKEKVMQVVTHTDTILKTNRDLFKEVAQKENIKETEVEKVIHSQMEIVAEPEKHVEQSISIPSTVSIEDYEEVKKMWTQQYEKGEVPVNENITTREQWVDQDTVFITNTLNKLLSPDDKIRNNGLDDLGYILPIFMINNLKGEELMVYLKAKLEAAKAVTEQIAKEKELTEQIKAKVGAEEEFVEVERPTEAKTAKTMPLQEELEIDAEKTPSQPQTPIPPRENKKPEAVPSPEDKKEEEVKKDDTNVEEPGEKPEETLQPPVENKEEKIG